MLPNSTAIPKRTLIVLCIIIIFLPTWCAALPRTPEDVIETTCGDNNTDGLSILLAYDTIHGSTAEIAEKITALLCARGFQVDLRHVRGIRSIDDYDVVILGTGIYELKFLLDAQRFLHRHQRILSEIPVVYFYVCAALSVDTPTTQEMAAEIYLDPILEKFPNIIPVETRGFGGAFDFTNYNLYERLLLLGFGLTESIDMRDWEKVEEWAEKLSELLPSL